MHQSGRPKPPGVKNQTGSLSDPLRIVIGNITGFSGPHVHNPAPGRTLRDDLQLIARHQAPDSLRGFVGLGPQADTPVRFAIQSFRFDQEWLHCPEGVIALGDFILAGLFGLQEFGLELLDIHGSAGMEKCWYSTEEYQRQAGVELVINRIIMLRELGGIGSLIMHVPLLRDREGFDPSLPLRQFDALRRSLDELTPVLEKYGARIAVENGFSDTFELIGRIMRDYPEQYFGITYDSGHGNVAEGKGMERLEPFRKRLQAVHLNDNDGSGDQHKPPFYGTVDWERMAEIIADSSYRDRPLSFEILIGHTPFCDPQAPEQRPENVRAFLKDARERCERAAKLFERRRK